MNDLPLTPWEIAGGVVAFLAVVYFLTRGTRKGLETRIGPLLDQLKSPYTVLTGPIIQDEQGMIRLDYVVVSPYGVFVIQELREVGRVEVRLNEEMWQVVRPARKKFYNPVWDIRKVIQKLERRVGNYPYIPLVVFTRARLTGDRDNSVLEAKALRDSVTSFNQERLSKDQQEKILGILG